MAVSPTKKPKATKAPTRKRAPAKPKTAANTRKPGAGKKANEDLFVVGIGASAGGLEALRPMVTSLPTLSNMTYVVVQHLSPKYRSLLAQLLGRETEIKIEEIKDGMVVEKNTIYITPPNKDVLIKNSTLRLRKPSSPVGPKPSVNAFSCK